MRLDRFLSVNGVATRREAERAARAGRILVNGLPERDTSRQIDPMADRVVFDGEESTARMKYNAQQAEGMSARPTTRRTVLGFLPSAAKQHFFLPVDARTPPGFAADRQRACTPAAFPRHVERNTASAGPVSEENERRLRSAFCSPTATEPCSKR